MKLPLLLVLLATPASAAFQDLAALDRQVAATVGAGVGEPGGAVAPIDRRLKLAACPQPPAVEPAQSGAVTVRCPALGWRLRVILRGGAGADAAPAAFHVRAIPVVRRGDPVAMTVETDSFAVTMEAVADQDGAPGDRIRVRTDGKSAPRMAQVVDAGRVTVSGFK